MPRYSLARARFREARALEMAAAGMDWPAISEELGYADRSGAHKAAMRALRRRGSAAVDEYRNKSLTEWDILVERSWPAATAGDVRASEVVLAAMDKRDRLLGLTGCDRPHAAGLSASHGQVKRAAPQPISARDADEGVFVDLTV